LSCHTTNTLFLSFSLSLVSVYICILIFKINSANRSHQTTVEPKADLKRRDLVMEVGLNTRYLTAKLTDDQRIEATAFETGKARLKGLHFVGVQVC
jgi:hypothetical protein